MPGLRVVLDTNVLASGLAYPVSTPGKIVNAWRQGLIDVVLSTCILEELARVLPRLTRLTLSDRDIRNLVDSFRQQALMTPRSATLSIRPCCKRSWRVQPITSSAKTRICSRWRLATPT